MVHVLFSYIKEPFSKDKFEKYLHPLPPAVKDMITKYRRWPESHTSLIGKLLLQEGLSLLDPCSSINEIRFSSFRRPSTGNQLDFNISHSENLVVCAVRSQGRLGIDVERIRDVNLENFKNQFHQSEWESIMNAEEKMKEFFIHWTKKEAVIKADGRGLSVPLDTIRINDNKCFLENQCWIIIPVNIHQNFVSHLAVDAPVTAINIKEMQF